MWLKINDTLRAIAEPLKAIAWPAVALVVAIVFREKIRELLSRVAEFMGTKFSPAAPAQTPSDKNPDDSLQVEISAVVQPVALQLAPN